MANSPKRGRAPSRRRSRAPGDTRRKPAKPRPALDDCVIPPKLAPEVASRFVLSGEAEHDRVEIRDYVEMEAGEQVTHAERIKAERIFGREYEVWDVHTNEA